MPVASKILLAFSEKIQGGVASLMQIANARAFCLSMLVCLSSIGLSGCQPLRLRDNVASRVSFLCWNLRGEGQSVSSSRYERALQLASLSPFELNNLLASHPAPEIAELHGRWHGINKGVGAAAIGLTQDIKVFDSGCACPRGHNVAVHQVALCDLACRGFQPKHEVLTCQEKTMGNFVVVAPCSACEPLKLDYTQADNSPLDPSRRLIDEIVMIDHDLLLGKAYLSIGDRLVPVAFFVLVRAPGCECDQQP